MNDISSAPLIDELDHQILMHCEVHFSGSFSLMYDYYAKEGKGILAEVSPERILELQKLQEYFGVSLSEQVLFDQEKEEVMLAKKKYHLLQQISSKKDSPLASLIVDLIFSEQEDLSSEIAAIVDFKEKAVFPLLELLSNEDFFNPLFPGYGEVPALAARCLGLIGDPRAIHPLFGTLGHGDFFMEEAIFDALANIGPPAKDFLISVLVKMPITKENEQAAIALIGFNDDPKIASTCLQMLQEEKNWINSIFTAYLIMGCQGLIGSENREAFLQISQRRNLSVDLRWEMDTILQKWKKES